MNKISLVSLYVFHISLNRLAVIHLALWDVQSPKDFIYFTKNYFKVKKLVNGISKCSWSQNWARNPSKSDQFGAQILLQIATFRPSTFLIQFLFKVMLEYPNYSGRIGRTWIRIPNYVRLCLNQIRFSAYMSMIYRLW